MTSKYHLSSSDKVYLLLNNKNKCCLMRVEVSMLKSGNASSLSFVGNDTNVLLYECLVNVLEVLAE